MHVCAIMKQKRRVVHPEILPSLAGLTRVGLDEAEPLGLEVARVTDYASRHLVRPSTHRQSIEVLSLALAFSINNKQRSLASRSHTPHL